MVFLRESLGPLEHSDFNVLFGAQCPESDMFCDDDKGHAQDIKIEVKHGSDEIHSILVGVGLAPLGCL